MQPSAAPVWWAYGALVLAGGSWALSAVLYRYWQRVGSPLAGVDVLWLTGLQALYGCLPLLALGWLLEGWRLTPSLDLAWTVAFTGLGAAGLANIVWFYLLRRRGAVIAAAPVFLVPVCATLFGILTLGEPLTPALVIGGLITLTGITIVTRAPR
jgi:O-acetylserine/cysteine efflux transporter